MRLTKVSERLVNSSTTRAAAAGASRAATMPARLVLVARAFEVRPELRRGLVLMTPRTSIRVGEDTLVR